MSIIRSTLVLITLTILSACGGGGNSDNTPTPPQANAGINQSVQELNVVTLDGSGSIANNSNPLTYSWSQISGTTVSLSSTTVEMPSFTVPELLTNETLVFQLIVNNGVEDSLASTIDINVTANDDIPIANAGTNQNQTEETSVTLDGTSSNDPEGQVITFSWAQVLGSNVALSDPTIAQPQFTVPNLISNETLRFELVVNDGNNNSSVSTVDIIITAENQNPIANAGVNQTVDEKILVSLNASASSDPESQPLTFLWSQISGTTVALSSATAAQPQFTSPDLIVNETLIFRLVVNDGVNNSLTTTVDVSVLATNDVPVANAGTDQNINEELLITLDGSNSSDPEFQALTFSWTQTGGTNVSLSSNTVAQPQFTVPNLVASETMTFQLVVNDGVNNSVASTVQINVTASNEVPTADAGNDRTITEGVSTVKIIIFNGTGSDPEGRPLTFSWSQTQGTAVTLSSTTVANPQFTLPNFVSDETMTFSLIVSDGVNNSIASTVNINIIATNEIPTADAGANLSQNEGTTILLDGSNSSDPENQALSFTWTQTLGATVALTNADTATPSFTLPSIASDGTLEFSLVVNDGVNDSATVTAQVTNINLNFDHDVVINKELMITDLSVVESVHTQPSGKWTFEHLITEMMPNPLASDEAKTFFLLNWLDQWATIQTINSFTVPARSGMQTSVIDPWLAASFANGKPFGVLDLSIAPFRLLAIVNRMDLAKRGVGSAVLDAGESRFVFGVLDSAGFQTQFTIIFEYGLPATSEAELDSWITDWHNMGTLPFSAGADTAFNDALIALTDRFTADQANPSKPNGSALNQIRTNEIALADPWELREFNLVGGSAFLQQVTVKDNPDLSLKDNAILAQLINDNEAEILTGKFVIPESFNNQAILGGASLNDLGLLAAINPLGVNNPEARHKLSLNTCMGCHGGETGVFFLHVSPRSAGVEASLSSFLTGINSSVSDPVLGGAVIRSFSELGDRQSKFNCMSQGTNCSP